MDIGTLSSGLADVVERVGPAVVRIEGRHHRPASGIVWDGNGTIVAAAHTLHHREVTVGLGDGKTAAARVIGHDPATDLVVLKADVTTTAPVWEGAAKARVGEIVLALGRPGRSARASFGIVQAAGDEWRTPGGARLERYLEVDGSLPKGFSGGPLVSARGTVLGLNTAGVIRGGTTVPTETLRRLVPAILAHGGVPKAWLGLGAWPAQLNPSVADKVGQKHALAIVSLAPGGPSEQAGVLVGDVLLTVDGTAMRSTNELLAWLADDRVGKTAKLKLLRAGQVVELDVALAARPAEE
jgi:serine protease DegQ